VNGGRREKIEEGVEETVNGRREVDGAVKTET